MKKNAKSNTKSKRSTRGGPSKPFTISIHGDGIDIDASFAGGNDDSEKGSAFGDQMTLLVDAITRRLNGSPPPATSNVQADPTAVINLLRELANSATPEQLVAWEAAASAAQKMLAMEIMGIVMPPPGVNSNGSNGRHASDGRVVQ